MGSRSSFLFADMNSLTKMSSTKLLYNIIPSPPVPKTTKFYAWWEGGGEGGRKLLYII